MKPIRAEVFRATVYRHREAYLKGAPMKKEDPLRSHILKVLDWHDAHVNFDAAVEGIPAQHYGTQPKGLPYSPWQLIEHIRLSQYDIFDFCRNPDYAEQDWPDDYWPKGAAPPSKDAWEQSITAFHADLEALRSFMADPKLDLFARIPHGSGQTYLREALLVVDHNAYHVGQLVAVRRLLGIWK